MPETAAYVRRQAARITPAVLENLLPKLPLFKMEFTQIADPVYPHLFEQLEFLADVVEDFAEGADKDLPFTALAEAVFALLFVHKHLHLISGPNEATGHADDSTVVRAVITANQEALAAYAARHHLAPLPDIPQP